MISIILYKKWINFITFINNLTYWYIYSYETSTYLNVLMVIKEKTELKLSEIIPHPARLNLGLFKAVSGNLDSSQISSTISTKTIF